MTVTAATTTRTKISNTNTDSQCFQGGFIQKALYRYNLWTGLYMLEPDERLWFHIFGWLFLSSFVTYMGVFAKGFIHGILGVVT
jgi:Small subunit of serine palmitoyltransferase-like